MQQLFLRLGILAVILTFSSCKNAPSDVATYMDQLETGEERAENVEILYSDSALVKVRIVGEEMITSLNRNNPSQRFTKGVMVYFYGPGQIITSTLSAKNATRKEKKSKIFFQDSVVWQSVLGDKLETEELIWDERKEVIYSDRFVVISRPDEKIWGQGFEATQDFTNAKINAVEGRKLVK